MDDLLEQLRWLLNLPVGATADDVSTQLQKLIDQLKPESEPGQAAAAARFDLAGHLARLTAQADPATHVGIATLTAVQEELSGVRAELAALHAKQRAAEVDSLVAAALQDGRLTPALEPWARDLGSTRIDALKGFVERATPILPAPGSTQTGGVPPQTTAGSADTPAAIARAALAWQTAQAAAGNVVSTAAAVAHVLPPHLANLSTLDQGA